MPKHSVSEAAKLAGVSRSHFYKKFIRPGLISVERDRDDKPVIDTAEIMRVCGELKTENTATTQNGQFDTPENTSINTALQVQLQLLREQLTAAQEREKIANERENRLMNQIDQLTSQLDTTTRLLEHRPAADPAKLEKEVNVLRKEFRFLGLRLWGNNPAKGE